VNLYDVLGVTKEATDDEIKQAYKALAQKHHPDKPNGDREKFENAKSAYEILSDKLRREQYDATGDVKTNYMDEETLRKMRCFTFLSGLLEQIVNKDDIDLAKVNILIIMLNIVSSNKASNEKAVLRFTELSNRRKEVIKRLNRSIESKEEDYFVSMLTRANEQQDLQVEKIKAGILDFDFMTDILNTYSYEIFIPPPQPTNVFITYNLSGSTFSATGSSGSNYINPTD